MSDVENESHLTRVRFLEPDATAASPASSCSFRRLFHPEPEAGVVGDSPTGEGGDGACLTIGRSTVAGSVPGVAEKKGSVGQLGREPSLIYEEEEQV